MKIKFLLSLVIAVLLLTNLNAQSFKLWVSGNGNDSNSGTKEAPFESIAMAQRKARELRRLSDPSISNGINIVLKQGTYFLYEPLVFRPEDSGTPGSPTVISSANGEKAVISGGMQLTGWKKYNGSIAGLPKKAKGKIWAVDIPKVGGRQLEFRQLWVNDKKAVRASSLNDGTLDRILSVDKKNEILWIPKPEFRFNEINQLEFVIHQWWAIAILRVKDIKIQGDSAGVSFHQPESHVEFEHPWPAPFIDKNKNMNGNSAFYFVSAPELLTRPGEWYEDLENGKVYYWPRENENMRKAKVVIPVLETVVKISGSLDALVSNIQFKDISFNHCGWLRPSIAGHVPLQAGFYMLDAYKLLIPGTPDKASLENQAWIGRQSAAVELECAENLLFESCIFRHLAATGIDLIYATHHNTINGCLFEDIGGTAIQAGFFGDENFEAHLPYKPTDYREVCRYETFSNNLITNVTNEDWGCVGIGVGYAHDIAIEHNEISNINYSGISLGWGWTPTINCMKNNRVFANEIHDFAKQMYDVGGIYTLSPQPNTEIRANAIYDLRKAPYAHDPNHFQYIYFDERSSYIRSVDNWTETDKFFSNTPGPGNEWTNNGPQVADSIKNAAGLEAEYLYLKEILK